VRRFLASVVLLALASGCAAPRPRPPAQTPAPPVAVTPPPGPEPLPTLPPTSVGPRTVTPAQPAVEPKPPPPIPQPPTAPPVPPAQRGRFVVLNFDNADVETVIQAASEIIGFNYVLSPDVRGKVTVQTSGRIAQEEVFGVLLAILEVHGFTAVKSGNLYKIIRIEGARERAVPTIVGPTPDPNRTTDEIVTQIVAIKYSSVNDLSALLRPLISTRGTLIAHRETNVLIITDTASNITRLLDIIRLVDVQVAQEELQIIPVTYADSAELATILTQLFATGRIRTTAPGTPPAPAGLPQPPGVQPPGPAGAPGASAERAPLIIPERRSNSLIVHAKKHEVETIRRLVSQLDVNIYGGRRVFIYYAENAKSKDLAATLNSIYGARDTSSGGGPSATSGPGGPSPTTPGRTPTPPPTTPPPIGGIGTGASEILAEGQVRFIADEITNAVIVTTFPRSWVEIENTIKQLDRMPRQVLIEVLVAEVTLTDELRLGIDWAVRQGRFNVANVNTGPPGLPTSTGPDGGFITLPRPVAGPTALVGPLGHGLTAWTFATDQFIAMLNALASENKVNIVSNPHVMTSENKKAIINVSTSVPIVTSQTTGQVAAATTTATTTTTTAGLNQTVEYRDAGVILTVTPRIGERGTVALDVKQEVNSVGPNVQPTNSPSFIKREAETSVVLLNNMTLVLGGLIQDTVTLDNRGIPFLRDIPVFGYLFRFTGRQVAKTELLLLITPRVVGTAVDAAKITNEMRRATPEIDEAVDNAPRAPRYTPTVPPPRPPLPGSPLPPSSPLAPGNQPPPPGGILPPPEPR
jgi:general secretion pathway protein D